MKNFFSRFKEHLKDDYGGRYLEVILSEVIKEDISLLKILFPALDKNILKSKNIEICIEDIFPSKLRNHRRADLAVKIKGKHIALLEIKYEDEAQEKQISDYINYSEKNHLCFTYLTQYHPSKKDLDVIERKKNGQYIHMLYVDIYNQIKKRGNSNKPVTSLLIDFMKENFMIYSEKIDENALLLLLIKGLYVKHSHGFGRKVSENNIKTIPELWDTLIDNVRILGDRIYNDFPNYFNNRFSIDFAFDPEFDLNLLKKDIDGSIKDGDSRDRLEKNRKTGGWFWICSAGKIKQANKDDSLYLSIGYSFYLDLQKRQLSKYLFGSVSGRGFESVEKDRKIKGKGRFPVENDCYLQLLGLCDESINEALDDNDKLRRSFKASLNGMHDEIMKKIK